MKRSAARVATAIVILASVVAAFVILRPPDAIFPGARPAAPPEQPATMPLEESRIFVAVGVRKERIEQDLEKAAPRDQRGSRRNPVGNPVVDDSVTWEVSRSKIEVDTTSGMLVARSTLEGTATLKGSVRIIRGDIGKLLGKVNPTNVPFSISPRFQADATVVARPELASNWRVRPNLSLDVNLRKAEVPIKHFGKIGVRDLLRDDLDKAVRKLQGDLESQIANDPFLEEAARDAHTRLCEAREIRIGDQSGTLTVDPIGWEASQPVIGSDEVLFGLGLRALLALSMGTNDVRDGRGCSPLPPLTISGRMLEPGLRLNVLATVGWQRLSELATKAAADANGGRIASCGANDAIDLTVDSIVLEPLGDRFLAVVGVQGSTCGFLRTRYRGHLNIVAKPMVDSVNQILGVSDVDVAFESSENLIAAGLFGVIAQPLLVKMLTEELRLDLKSETERARDEAQNALEQLLADLQKHAIRGDGQIESIGIQHVAVRTQALQLLLAAKGSLRLNLVAQP